MKCSGQPWKKQPSTNTATRARRKTKSAVRRISGIGFALTRYRSPRACTAERTNRSGLVPVDLHDIITRRVRSDEAHDLPRSANNGSKGLPRGPVGTVGRETSCAGGCAPPPRRFIDPGMQLFGQNPMAPARLHESLPAESSERPARPVAHLWPAGPATVSDRRLPCWQFAAKFACGGLGSMRPRHSRRAQRGVVASFANGGHRAIRQVVRTSYSASARPDRP